MDTICGHTITEYMKMVEDFHGHLAPGLLVGGFMVDLALKNKPEGEFYDVICETSTCLPDAITLLTPCTYGNGWMKVVNIGRFALTVFDKYNGSGVRVNISTAKLDEFNEIKNWFLKLKKKNEQDKDLLIAEIIKAGSRIFDMQKVNVVPNLIGKTKGGKIGICKGCGESYPLENNNISTLCLACKGTTLYV